MLEFILKHRTEGEVSLRDISLHKRVKKYKT